MITTNFIHCLSYCAVEIIIRIVITCMPGYTCAAARYTYTCVCVSRLLQLPRDHFSIGKISICGFAKIMLLELWLRLLTWNPIVAFSGQCVAKLVHGVLLLYLRVVEFCTRTLAIGSCKSEKRATKLHLLFHAAINFIDTLNFLHRYKFSSCLRRGISTRSAIN